MAIDNGNGSSSDKALGKVLVPTPSYPPRPKRVRSRIDAQSVQREPPDAGMMPLGDFIFTYATIADEIPPWGSRIASRDRELRRFWPTENVFASALYSMVAKYAGMAWHLDGPPRTCAQIQRMLNSVEFGKGWIALWTRVLNDLFTQDNGAFVEVVRTKDEWNAPVVSLNHLDANRCIRTGWRDQPVIYYDSHNVGHLLQWYQVITFEEFPSPIESMRGVQYCCLTRLLRAAQTLRDISVYKREKISGRFNKAIYFVSGVQQRTVKDQLALQQQEASQEGLTRYIQPIIVASLDPGANVKVDKIELASLPDGFDENEAMRWYVNQLALAFGGDYQDFSPLPGGNLGSSQQSRNLDQKARNKGVKLFMMMVEQAFNYMGIMPSNIGFVYEQQDLIEEIAKAELRMARAKERAQRILSGEITVEIARQIAADEGDLKYEYLEQLNEGPMSEYVAIEGAVPVDTQPGLLEAADDSAYTGTSAEQEAALVIAGQNANLPEGQGGGTVGSNGAGGMVNGSARNGRVRTNGKKLVPTKNGRADSGGAAMRTLMGRNAPGAAS